MTNINESTSTSENCKSQLCSLFTSGLALGSAGCSFVVCRLSPCPKYLINPYNAIFLKSQGSKDIKNDILDCQIHKYTNTNSQIHKYSLWWSAGNTQHVLYFWKAKGSRTSKMTFLTVKYTKTNSQIQHMTKCQKYPIYAIYLNSFWFKDLKNDNPQCPEIRIGIDSIWERGIQIHSWRQTFALYHQIY